MQFTYGLFIVLLLASTATYAAVDGITCVKDRTMLDGQRIEINLLQNGDRFDITRSVSSSGRNNPPKTKLIAKNLDCRLEGIFAYCDKHMSVDKEATNSFAELWIVEETRKLGPQFAAAKQAARLHVKVLSPQLKDEESLKFEEWFDARQCKRLDTSWAMIPAKNLSCKFISKRNQGPTETLVFKGRITGENVLNDLVIDREIVHGPGLPTFNDKLEITSGPPAGLREADGRFRYQVNPKSGSFFGLFLPSSVGELPASFQTNLRVNFTSTAFKDVIGECETIP